MKTQGLEANLESDQTMKLFERLVITAFSSECSKCNEYCTPCSQISFDWFIHVVRTENFPKIQHFLPDDTHTYVCASGGKK